MGSMFEFFLKDLCLLQASTYGYFEVGIQHSLGNMFECDHPQPFGSRAVSHSVCTSYHAWSPGFPICASSTSSVLLSCSPPSLSAPVLPRGLIELQQEHAPSSWQPPPLRPLLGCGPGLHFVSVPWDDDGGGPLHRAHGTQQQPQGDRLARVFLGQTWPRGLLLGQGGLPFRETPLCLLPTSSLLPHLDV